jgi:AAA domain
MTEPQKQELEKLIARIDAHRESLKLSHSRFATRFAKFVGSHKSWEFRLFPRKWDELKPETWLPKLRVFVNEIDGTVGLQEIFSELPIVKHGVYLYETLQGQKNDRRCGVLLGPMGTGKTLAFRHIQRENNFVPVFVSANETWKDSRMQIAGAFAKAISAPKMPSAAQTFQSVIDVLKSNPMDILIDEAHEGGVLLMKLVKSIINETQSRVMLGIYPTAWQRLLNGANDAYAEAQQLLRRTIRPIKKDWIVGVNEMDIEAWLHAVKLSSAKPRIPELLPLARRYGNYSLLTDALERSRVVADEQDGNVTADLFVSQVREICGSAEPKKEKK